MGVTVGSYQLAVKGQQQNQEIQPLKELGRPHMKATCLRCFFDFKLSYQPITADCQLLSSRLGRLRNLRRDIVRQLRDQQFVFAFNHDANQRLSA